MSKINRNNIILKKEISALLVIDIQERIIGVMQNENALLENCRKLIKGIKILNIPIFYTEQYPKGLGSTVEVLRNELTDSSYFEKSTFSCFGAADLFEQLKQKNITQLIVAGIESHVCVQQTVLDLLSNGFQVNVVADAISSRKLSDYDCALERMSKHNAEITTTESVLFELLETSGTDEFKAVSKLIK